MGSATSHHEQHLSHRHHLALRKKAHKVKPVPIVAQSKSKNSLDADDWHIIEVETEQKLPPPQREEQEIPSHTIAGKLWIHEVTKYEMQNLGISEISKSEETKGTDTVAEQDWIQGFVKLQEDENTLEVYSSPHEAYPMKIISVFCCKVFPYTQRVFSFVIQTSETTHILAAPDEISFHQWMNSLTNFRDVFSTVPIDVVLSIFRTFTYPELCKIAPVCKRINSLSSDDAIWKEIFQSSRFYDLTTVRFTYNFKRLYRMRYLMTRVRKTDCCLKCGITYDISANTRRSCRYHIGKYAYSHDDYHNRWSCCHDLRNESPGCYYTYHAPKVEFFRDFD